MSERKKSVATKKRKKKTYRVFNPQTNQYMRGQWKNIEDIPYAVMDAFDNPVLLESLQIVDSDGKFA